MRWVIAGSIAVCSAAAMAQPTSTDAYLKLFDSNGDGLISQAEYVVYMSRGFHALDVNHDGLLDASEMPPSHRQRGPLSEAQHRRNLIQTFRRQDINQDGSLDAAELAEPPH